MKKYNKIISENSLALLFAIILFCAVSYKGLCQSLATYTVTRTTGITYNSIASTGNSVASWRNTATYSQDDNRSGFNDIGFDFWYDGTRYTQFSISTNGFIDFSTSTADGTGAASFGYDNTAFSASAAANAARPAIAPFYDDLTAQGGTAALGNSIKYEVSGTVPNRILTIEWINMAVYANTTPNLNFQVKLYETTGMIELLYGTMTQGTNAFSYTAGINAPTVSNPPTAAQLLDQQTANTATFSKTAQNSLSTMPTTNSKLTFTPASPANPSGSLTFSAVTNSSMTLNWTNWATNEIGYIIYNSTDGINYSFVAQTAANAISQNVTGLLPGTLYYWEVYAVTEGKLSSALSASQSTSAAGSKISIASGNWNTAGTWSPSGVPAAGDNVTIANGTTVTINTNATCDKLTVGTGTSGILTIGTNTTAYTITINNDILVNSGATFNVNTASNTSHTLLAKGNITNNGTLNFATDANSLCNVTFEYNGNQTISGSGATNNYNLVTVNMGTSPSNILEVTSSAFSAASGFLTLTNGTFKYSSPGTTTITPFTATTTIGTETGLCINSANATVNINAGIILYGSLNLTAGTVNIGNASNENIQSEGGLFSISGGAVNVAGMYYCADMNSLSNFSMSGGTFTLATYGSTSTTNAPFDVTSPGSSFTMSSGTIVIQKEGGSGAQNLGYSNTGASASYNVSGGKLQIGNASTTTAQIMQINSNIPVPNLVISSTNSPTAQLSTNTLNVLQNITINSGGTLNANNLDVTVGGNWINNGGTYTAGTNTTTFSGANQNITKTTGETFNNLVLSGTNTKTLGGPITINGNLTLSSTLDVSSSSYGVTLKGNWTNNGSFTQQNGTVSFAGTSAQSIAGSSVTNFNNMTISNSAGVTASTAQNLNGVLNLSGSGVFNANGNLTLISNSSSTASIGSLATPANFTGNITMQRYVSGAMGYRYIGSAINGATLSGLTPELELDGMVGGTLPTYWCNVYTYNEAATGAFATGWTAAGNVTDPMTTGKGFATYFYDFNIPVTLDLSGPINKGNQSLPVTFTSTPNTDDGWNLVSNPYPSTIDWDAASGWTRTNIQGNTIYYWNDAAQNYASYPTGGPGVNGGTRYIPSSQGFLVKASAASPVLSMTENVKTSTNPSPFFWKTSTQSPYAIKLTLSNDVNTFSDESVIRFIKDANENSDAYDAYKIPSTNPSAPYIATLSADSVALCINSLPEFSKNFSVPVQMEAGVAANYKITVTLMNNFPSNACLALEDLKTSSVTNVQGNASYSFFSDTIPVKRFVLHISPSIINIESSDVLCNGQSNGSLTLTGNNSASWNYSVLDSAGNNISSMIGNMTDTTISGLKIGKYVVSSSDSDTYCNAASDTIVIHQPMPVSVSVSNFNPTCNSATTGSATALASGGNGIYSYSWSNGTTTSTISNLSPGNYIVTVNDANNCSEMDSVIIQNGPSVVTAGFNINKDTVSIAAGGIVLFSNISAGSNSYLWTFGDNDSSADVNPYHVYADTGSYSVKLKAFNSNGCMDSVMHKIIVLQSDPLTLKEKNLRNAMYIYCSEKDIVISWEQNMGLMNISVLNTLGKQLFLTENVPSNNGNIYRIDGSTLSSGIYFVKITSEKTQLTKKIIYTKQQ